MSGASRDIVAVVVAAESPIGRASESVEQCATHLPPAKQAACGWCSKPWPCLPFIGAGRAAHAAGLRVSDFTPPELHDLLPRELNPKTTPSRPSALSDQTTPFGFPPIPGSPHSPA